MTRGRRDADPLARAGVARPALSGAASAQLGAGDAIAVEETAHTGDERGPRGEELPSPALEQDLPRHAR
jgi:hypothetical protein